MPTTILVTGANKGIGYEAVKLLSQRKPEATILLGSRSTKNGEEAITKMRSSLPSHSFSNVKVLEIDITSSSSLSSAIAHIQSEYTTLDVLLHNSGISNLDGDDRHPAIFDVNVRGAKATIEAFTPILTPHTGIVTLVSSEVGSWYTAAVSSDTRAKLLDTQGTTWEKVEGWMKDWDIFASGGKAEMGWVPLEMGTLGNKYCASKGMVNSWIRSFAANHPKVKVAVVCPGYCATELNNWQGTRSAEKGGESVIWPVVAETFESGKFYRDGEVLAYESEMPEDWDK